MIKADFDFSDKRLSGEERLTSFVALNRGLTLGLADLFHRVNAYHDLLEQELEHIPAAAEYLARMRQSAAKGIEWLDAFRETVIFEEEDCESFAIGAMVSGAVDRCRRILPRGKSMALTLPADEIVVAGSLFQLQELFMKTIQGFVDAGQYVGDVVRVNATVQELDDGVLKLLKSSCLPGHYFVLSLSGGDEAFDAGRLQSFWDVFAEGYGDGGPDSLAFLQDYGMAVTQGGDIVFQSSDAACPVCHLLLPVEGKRKDMQAPHNIEDESLYGTETILLVDDEDMIWDVIIDMLQELGYSVILAGNGRDAVEIYRENPGQIDLIILDMVMPELDGHEAFFLLKEIDPEVRVLLSSGYVSEDDAGDVLEAGALGFLQKPYRMIDLARIVRNIFGRSP